MRSVKQADRNLKRKWRQYIFIRHNTDGKGEEAVVVSSLLYVKVEEYYFILMRVIRDIRKNLHMNFSLKHTCTGFFKITFKKFSKSRGKEGDQVE